MFGNLYFSIIYQPIFNLLVWLYNIVPGHDLGVAIILFTIIFKIILSPFFIQSIKAQRKMQAIQPKLDEVKEKYKDSKEKLGVAMMELYKKEKVSPFSSCLPLLVQMPILIAIFQTFQKGLSNGSLNSIYSFIYNPGSINPISLGFINLSKSSWVIAILAGLAQYWQSRLMIKRKKDQPAPKSALAASMNQQMLYFMPAFTAIIGFSLPAGLTFYWLLTTVLSALQQILVFKKMDNQPVTEIK
jgi:YidC/Oxa1 family membrane protein insertase